jgi:hypothetical protein
MTENQKNVSPSEQKSAKFEMHMPEGLGGEHGHHARLGPILGVLVIVLFLIFAGLYLWGSTLREQAALDDANLLNNEPETPRAVADAEILSTLSPSDDLGAIEADLMSTNLDSIESDLTAIDAELDAVSE